MNRPPQTFPDRCGSWWDSHRQIIGRWAGHAVRTGRPGLWLKTDLYDEACGEMHLLGSLREEHFPLGIDIDRNTAQEARRRLAAVNIQACCVAADVRNLPFRSACVSGVLSISTLDHLNSKAEIDTALREIRRVTIPGGLLLWTMDNPHNPEVALRAWLPPYVVHKLRADAFPLGTSVSAREGREMLLHTGLSVVKQALIEHAPRYGGIRIAKVIDRARHGRSSPWLLRLLRSFECLTATPLAGITGHYALWIAKAASDETA